MNISIVSEMDSRAAIYPLMQILSHFGSVAVVSPQRSMRRLIDGNTAGEFAGIQFDLDDNPEVPTADFMIFDNQGMDSADVIIAVVGAAISEQFAYDLEVVINNPITHVIKFGKPLPAKNEKKKKSDEIPDLATELTMEENLIRVLTSRKSKWVPIIGIEDVENLESLHKWPRVNQALASEVFRILSTKLCADEHVFMKEVMKPNEDSIDINPLYIR